jgi:hypothetical protein
VASWFAALPSGEEKAPAGDNWVSAGLPVCRIKNKFALGAEVGIGGIYILVRERLFLLPFVQ